MERICISIGAQLSKTGYIHCHKIWAISVYVITPCRIQCQDLVWYPAMMTSSNGNIFRITGPLRGEFTGLRWIPHTKASDKELWCILWSVPE